MWKLWFFFTFVDHVKTNKHMFDFFSPSGSYTILVYRSYIDTKHRAASLRQQSFLFWYARALAVRNTSRGVAEWRISYNQRDSVYIYIKNTYCMGKRPFLFLLLIYVRFLTIFYAKNMGLSFIADVVRHYDSERVCRWGVFLNSVRPTGSTPFNAFSFWVIFCHITLERSWVVGFCLHFCWMYVATAITYSEPSPS